MGTLVVSCLLLVYIPTTVMAASYTNDIPDYWYKEWYKNGTFNLEILARECERMGYLNEACLPDKRGLWTCDDEMKPVVLECEVTCGDCEFDAFDTGYCRCLATNVYDKK